MFVRPTAGGNAAIAKAWRLSQAATRYVAKLEFNLP
jgi:hypothetical protein